MEISISERQKTKMAIYEALANPLAGRPEADPADPAAPAEQAALLAEMAAEGWPVYFDTALAQWQAGDGRRLLSAAEIGAQLPTKWLGHNLLYYAEADSTNLMAKLCIAQQVPRGTVIVAEKQTAGRGRLLRHWVSLPRIGLWFSVILSPFAPAGAALLSFLTAVAVCRVIREVAGLPAVLKWPNDVMICGRKVCGILLEAGSDGQSVIVGVGLNVSQRRDEFPAALQETATSLALEARRPFDRPFLLAAILSQIETRVETLIDTGSAALMDEYRSLCATIGKRVRIDFPNSIAEYGVVSGVADSGAVIFIPDAIGAGGAGAAGEGAGGRAREVMAGDITHLRTQT